MEVISWLKLVKLTEQYTRTGTKPGATPEKIIFEWPSLQECEVEFLEISGKRSEFRRVLHKVILAYDIKASNSNWAN